MSVFVSSTTSTNRHGAFAIEKTVPPQIKAIGTGVVALVGQFPWGPVASLQSPPGTKEFGNMFAPPGSNRLSSGYLASIAKAWPQLMVVGVKGPTAATATRVFSTFVTITAKYPGTMGNSISITVSAASDGDANHVKIVATLTGTSGTTTDTIDNYNSSAVGTQSAPDLTSMLLIGSIAITITGVVTPQTLSLTGGTDGVVTSAEYIGTAGTADKGFAVLEGSKLVRHVISDDTGNTIRAAVNAGLLTQCNKMGDRVGYVSGNSGQAQSAAFTDVATVRGDRMVYVDPWIYIRDDVTGALQLVPGNTMAASVKSQLSPSTSLGWKNAEVQSMTQGIVKLEVDRGEAAGNGTDNGIATIIQEEGGGFTFEAGVTTIAPVDNTKRTLNRRTMGDYMAVSVVRSIRGSVDQPNVPQNQDDLTIAVSTFLANLKAAQFQDPNHTPHILDYSMPLVSSVNTQADLDAGQFTIAAVAKESSAMEKIFFSLQHGEGVIVAKST